MQYSLRGVVRSVPICRVTFFVLHSTANMMRPGCLQQRHVTAGRPSCPLGRASRREARACAALVENSTSAPSKPESNGDGAPDIEGMV